MKMLKPIYTLMLLASAALVSCEKDEFKVTFEGGNDPVLTASSTTDVVLQKSQENYTSLQFHWTNPEYEFSNGVNTQDVFYTLEVDTVGSNFSNPKAVAVTYTRDVNKQFTVRELNTTLSGMELKDFVPHNFEFRIKATLSSGSVPRYSNTVQIKITTYLDVVFPVPAKLFITGAATPKGWMGDNAPAEPTQEFTKTNAYTFVITSLQINANSGFLFVPVYGNWGTKYGFTGEKELNNVNGDAFEPNGTDFKSPGTAKAYKITVNFKTGKYSFE